MFERVGAIDMDRAAALRTKLTRMDGKAIALIIVIAVLSHHRIDQVQLNIRAVQTLTSFQESPGLQEIIRARTGFRQQIFDPNRELFKPGLFRIGGSLFSHFMNDRDVQMILQIGADIRAIVQTRHPIGFKKLGRPNAGQLKDLGRLNRAGADNHFLGRMDDFRLCARFRYGFNAMGFATMEDHA